MIELSCFICDKHKGIVSQPPGGYIYEDGNWMVCHFPADQAVPGRLVLESKRHFLDFAEMTDDEANSYGILVKKIYALLKEVTGAERIYSLTLIDGVPHFHVHFFPRLSGSPARGLDFLMERSSCDENDAVELALRLKALLGE